MCDRGCNPQPKPNQAELLRLDPTLVSSLPSAAEPVLRSIHACFVAARLLSLSGVRSNMFADLPSSSLAEIAMLMDLHEVPAGHYFSRNEP